MSSKRRKGTGMYIVIVHDNGREPHCAAFKDEALADRLCTVVNRVVGSELLGYYEDCRP